MSSKREITSDKLAVPNGHFSQATIVEASGRLLFISGMTARCADGTVAGIGDIDAQTRQVCENLKAAVTAAGGCAGEIGWRFPITLPELEHDADQLLADWNRRTEGRFPHVFLGKLVCQLRTWRPSVVVIDKAPDDDATTSLLNKAIRLCPVYPTWYLSGLAWAYLLMGRREDAIASAEKSISMDADYPFNYMVLAVAFAELGREEEAHAAVENLLRIDPSYSLRTFSECQPFRDAEVLDRHIEGLRKAGLPE